ncbi:MAG: hypothetical protein C4340_07275 [Armatimonadota bacterium]
MTETRTADALMVVIGGTLSTIALVGAIVKCCGLIGVEHQAATSSADSSSSAFLPTRLPSGMKCNASGLEE